MINAAHILLYSHNPDADRAFFKDVLQYPFVDVGHGWLIFKMPPSEVAVHPADASTRAPGDGTLAASLYLMCDDLAATMASLNAQHVSCSAITTERWGHVCTITLPGGSKLGLYQPTHPTAHDL